MLNRVSGLFDGSQSISNEIPGPLVRVDLHCHSDASNEADEAMLNAIACPESFSSPGDVYEQAKSRSMDFVTITDHDSIAGVARLAKHDDVLVGEELTCYFPEDRCKIHLLVWGLNEEDHNALQAVAGDIYKVAAEIENRNLAHSVAHPLYRQNDRLEKWHLERLILMFKGFETLNGAHSVLHRQAVEPMLDSLTPQTITDLAISHDLCARWPQPHVKSRTGGSDDHGLFNIGRTWTEFPSSAKTIEDLLDCLRTGNCAPGGEAGSSLKLAHNFYGVGVRYYQQKIQGESRNSNTHGLVLKSLIGDRRHMRRRDIVKAVVKHKAKKWGRKLARPFRSEPQPTGSGLLLKLFIDSCGRRLGENEAIGDALRTGRAALGEHTAMFDFLSTVNRDIATGIADSVMRGLADGELTAVFDSVSSVVAHQFILLPYYFALFHQNRERHVLSRITGNDASVSRQKMKLGVFTDTFDEINGVGRFIQDMSRQARLHGRDLIVHTSTSNPTVACPSRKNFTPLLSRPLPYYPDQPLTIPPLVEILEWADRQQFDAIHVHTPGPMGLCGWLVAKMLRIPCLGTYHTDFPQYVHNLTGDHRLTTATEAYMKWFYGQTRTVLSRSKDYRTKLKQMGFTDDRLAVTLAGVDTEKFTPEKRDESIWKEYAVQKPLKLLYVGRVSLEKNLLFLTDAFKKLCKVRSDVSLVIVGDGPYRAEMEKKTAGLPVHFLGYHNDQTLPALYASSDLFVFPSETDTLGQVVIEAQASGLPVLVSNVGGPKEVTDDGITGRVLPTNDTALWASTIDQLLTDTPARLRMSRTGPQRATRFSLPHTFENFWDQHFEAVGATSAEQRKMPEISVSSFEMTV